MLYLVALYGGHPEFLPLLGVLVLVTAVAYWVSAARVIWSASAEFIAYNRMIRRRARVLRDLQGGAR